MNTWNRIACIVSLAVAAAALASAQQSDKTAVYAKIEKVVVLPNADNPQTAQIWGVFSLADPTKLEGYLPAKRGYLYFRAARDPVATRTAWTNITHAVGRDIIISFSNRNISKPTIRDYDAPAENPDRFDTNIDVSQVYGRADYPPVKSILEFKK